MPRAGLDKKTTSDLVRLLVFMITTGLATGVLVVTIGNLSFGSTKEYRAEFSDATGVVSGDDVRIAGVKVGNVQDVEIADDNRALVTFTVADDTRIDAATHATIKYRNLIGQRYISLGQDGQSDDVLTEGETIPVTRTQPALDLTALFNGFKPLFERCRPTTSTSSPTRSSRCSRARAAPSRACSPAPPPSRRRSPTTTG